jgi:DNA repair exonuclease SbcCD ATPase subunit
LVDLFGKKKYEERIKELELLVHELAKDKDELTSNLEKREEKIRKLSSYYQEAKLALKAIEQKAVSSEAKPAILCEEPQEPKGELHHGQKMRPLEMRKLLKRLQAVRSPEEDLLSAYQESPTGLPPELANLAGSIRSNRGMALFHCPQLFSLILVPPLPLKASPPILGGTFHMDPLQEILETPVLVILAHAGDTFLGLALSSSGFEVQETVESQIKEKHSKGGWSQKRFERLREEEIKSHADAVVRALKVMAERWRSIARYAVLSGDPALVKMILPAIDLPVVERRLERHDQKRLDKVLDDIYAFTCYRGQSLGADVFVPG